MPKFYENLRRSWVVNRFTVGAWYLGRRFPLLHVKPSRCIAMIQSPYGGKSYQVLLDDKEDFYQALNIFRNENPWSRLKLDTLPRTIVDLGANRGLSTLFWRLRFPQAEVHGVEMDAGNADRCRQLFSDNNLSATFHCVAIADHDGSLNYRTHDAHTRHRLDALVKPDDPYAYGRTLVKVPCQTFASFLAGAKLRQVDLLKVDIEGAEQFLLESMETWANSVRLLLLEIHHNIDPDWARDKLLNAGFAIQLGDGDHRTEWWCHRQA